MRPNSGMCGSCTRAGTEGSAAPRDRDRVWHGTARPGVRARHCSGCRHGTARPGARAPPHTGDLRPEQVCRGSDRARGSDRSPLGATGPGVPGQRSSLGERSLHGAVTARPRAVPGGAGRAGAGTGGAGRSRPDPGAERGGPSTGGPGAVSAPGGQGRSRRGSGRSGAVPAR